MQKCQNEKIGSRQAIQNLTIPAWTVEEKKVLMFSAGLQKKITLPPGGPKK